MHRLRDIIQFRERFIEGTPNVSITGELIAGVTVELSSEALEQQRGQVKEELRTRITHHLYGKIEEPLHRIVMIALEAAKRGVLIKDGDLEITTLETDILRIVTGYADL